MKIKALLFIIISIAIIQNTGYSAVPENINITDIKLPAVNSLTMKNGLRLFYIKDDLPQITITLSVGFGKMYEKSKNAGISNLLAKTLSLAGSKKYKSQALHSAIESIGGRFAIQSSWEQTYITIKALERYADLAFDIISDIIFNPNFKTDIIKNARSMLIEDVRRKKDSPDVLAFEKAREIIFNGNGYGSISTVDSLNSISKKDLIRAHSKYFKAKNIILGIASSVEFDKIEKKVKKSFGSLLSGSSFDYSIDKISIANTIKEKANNIYLIPKDIPQATIVVGTIAPNIKETKIFPLKIMNYILGGGSFSSRLMHEIRVKRGLSYAVQSIIKFRKRTGVFLTYAQTKNESTPLTFSLMLENINLMKEKRVSISEIDLAKESIKNSYIFEFDTPLNILKKYTFLSYNGLIESFLLEYVRDIDSVSSEEILKNSNLLLKDGLIKVVVGKEELNNKLKKWGNVITIKE